jgi:ABC-2 type transport system permease protein
VLASPAVYLAPFAVLSLIPVYALWALPTVGWLMMVSAGAKTKVFLWAVGVPVLTGILLLWFNEMFKFGWDIQWYWKNIVGRGLAGVIPGNWFAFVDPPGGMQVHDNDMHLGFLVMQSWKTLASVQAWIGAVAGAAMLYAAARLRRWKDEG